MSKYKEVWNNLYDPKNIQYALKKTRKTKKYTRRWLTKLTRKRIEDYVKPSINVGQLSHILDEYGRVLIISDINNFPLTLFDGSVPELRDNNNDRAYCVWDRIVSKVSITTDGRCVLIEVYPQPGDEKMLDSQMNVEA